MRFRRSQETPSRPKRPLEDNPYISFGDPNPPRPRYLPPRRPLAPRIWQGIKTTSVILFVGVMFALGPINIAMVFIDPFIGLMMFPLTGWIWVPAYIWLLDRRFGWGIY